MGGSEQGGWFRQYSKLVVPNKVRTTKWVVLNRITRWVILSGYQGWWFNQDNKVDGSVMITKSTDLYFASRGQGLSDDAMWSGCQGL